MSESRSTEIKLYGIDFVKFLHIFVQIIFIPVTAVRLEHNFQILIPLPIGVFIILSIFCNIVVFIPHLLENRHRMGFTLSSNGLRIQETKFFKKRSTSFDLSKYTLTIEKIHESLGWTFVFFLGFSWNLYMASEGVKLLSVKAFYQGLPMFFYGFLTELFYLVMWFLPDAEITVFNTENPIKSKIFLIPSIILSFKLKQLYLGKKKLFELRKIFKIEEESERTSLGDFLKQNWIFMIQMFTWVVVWILGASFTFDFYHYQFVAAFSFVLLVFYLRMVIYKKKKVFRNPWWIYPFWILTFHEVGVKTWNLTALGFMSPSSIIWTLPIAWLLFLLVITSTILEVFRIHTLIQFNKKVFIGILIVLSLEVVLQFTAFLSTYRFIPFYLSLIEIGPIF